MINLCSQLLMAVRTRTGDVYDVPVMNVELDLCTTQLDKFMFFNNKYLQNHLKCGSIFFLLSTWQSSRLPALVL